MIAANIIGWAGLIYMAVALLVFLVWTTGVIIGSIRDGEYGWAIGSSAVVGFVLLIVASILAKAIGVS